jgi:DNA topoisomerase-1
MDKAMDKAGAKANVPVGISVRNGPVPDDEMDVDEPLTNGNAKRKSRGSTSKAVNYNVDGTDGESDDDAVPLVCADPLSTWQSHSIR